MQTVVIKAEHTYCKLQLSFISDDPATYSVSALCQCAVSELCQCGVPDGMCVDCGSVRNGCAHQVECEVYVRECNVEQRKCTGHPIKRK